MLAGNLSDFPLADVLHFLARTRKTGTLRVRTGDREGRVTLVGGAVSAAVSDAVTPPAALPLLVVAAFEEAELRRLQAAHQAGDREAVDAILGTVPAGPVEQFLRDQICDAVFDLLRLAEGRFEFAAGHGGAPGRGLIAVEEIVNECTRRLEGWEGARRRVPSSDLVVALRPDAGEGVALSPQDWRTIALVDGSRTVADLLALTGRGKSATLQLLAELVDRGLVELVETGSDPAVTSMLARWEALRSGDPLPAPEKTVTALLETPGPPGVDGPPAEAPATPPARTEPAPAAPSSPSPPATPPLDPPAHRPVTAAGPAAARPAAARAGQAPGRPLVARASSSAVDRAQIARELASLGLDLASTRVGAGIPRGAPAVPRPSASASGKPAPRLPLNGNGSPNGNGAANGKNPSNGNGVPNGKNPPNGNGAANGKNPSNGKGVPTGNAAPNSRSAPRPSPTPSLSRDDDVSKGLLLRLLDGVKGS